jgi:hypothetical protein
MKLKLLVAAIALAASSLASATTVIIFGQTDGPGILATESGGTTTIGVAGGFGSLMITQIAPGVTNPVFGTLSLNLTSNGLATVNAGVLTQYYSGNFSVYDTSVVPVNVLTATFSNARMSGTLGGGALEFGDSTVQDNSLLFTSGLISAGDLGVLRAMSFSFTNLNVPVAMANNSLASFTSNFSGNDSANLTTVPEPATGLLTGLGLLGLVASRRGKRA